MKRSRRIIALLLLVVLVFSLSTAAFAASSAKVTCTNKNKMYYLAGQTKGGWFWWKNPTTTITLKVAGNAGTRVAVYLNTGAEYVYKGDVAYNCPLSISITGKMGQGVSYTIRLQPCGKCSNGNYGVVTATASSGSIYSYN